jgi:PAS domain S-box-containing protein
MTGVPAVSTFPTLPAQIPGVVMQSNDAGTKRRVVETGMPAQVMTGVFPGVATGRGRKSVAQIERRRERNRILARRTRLRKKFFFESLQKDVTDLQRENSILKELVKQKLPPDVSQQLLADCDAMEQLPPAVQEVVGENLTDMDSQDFNLVRSIQRSQQCFVITDPSLQDNPIVYASDDFLTLTGYKREDVLGRNCRFLQGTETSPQKVEQVRKAVAMGEDVAVTMINYTADGTAFWNKLFIAALRDAQNNIVNFIGVIVKVAAPDPDDPEAGKRLPGEHAGGDDDEDDDDDDDNMADY